MLMCKTHWRMVPGPIQNAVWRTFKKDPGGPVHIAAIEAAIDAVRKQVKA
jgi:hypothetical protein